MRQHLPHGRRAGPPPSRQRVEPPLEPSEREPLAQGRLERPLQEVVGQHRSEVDNRPGQRRAGDPVDRRDVDRHEIRPAVHDVTPVRQVPRNRELHRCGRHAVEAPQGRRRTVGGGGARTRRQAGGVKVLNPRRLAGADPVHPRFDPFIPEDDALAYAELLRLSPGEELMLAAREVSKPFLCG